MQPLQMAHQSVNCAYLLVFFVTILFVCNFCQASGDFAINDDDDDDYYDDFSFENPQKNLDKNIHEMSEDEKVNKLNLDRKLQDYLLNIQSQVFTSNDVLTVKDRKPSITSKRPLVNKFTSEEHNNKSSIHQNVQSDQPYNSGDWTAPLEATPSASTSKPKEATASGAKKVIAANEKSGIESAYSIQPWICQFQANQDCGIINDPSIGSYFKLESRDFFRNFNWKSWYLLLNASKVPADAVGARLITPYMQTHSNASKGCLSLHYVTTGNGVARVTLYQQDKNNHCVDSRESNIFPIGMPINHKMDFTVDLFRGSPRYFLELYLDFSKPHARESIFALASLQLTYRPCLVNHANQCRPPQTTNEAEIVMP